MRLFQVSFIKLANSRISARVGSVRTLSVPTVMDPTAQAMDSISVDFPLPFSPTKKLTDLFKNKGVQRDTTGRLKGNLPDGVFVLRSIFRKWIILLEECHS